MSAKRLHQRSVATERTGNTNELSIMDEMNAAQRVQAAARAWLDAVICHERIREALLMRDAQRRCVP